MATASTGVSLGVFVVASKVCAGYLGYWVWIVAIDRWKTDRRCASARIVWISRNMSGLFDASSPSVLSRTRSSPLADSSEYVGSERGADDYHGVPGHDARDNGAALQR